ncbi:hypothetical protein E2C01_033790 [Portunus trituberculatus]|uniref:Uncharacterized protein n=1 Tax=Portunus trituberculatus TaxID=210409 RepID=A0A5B7F6L6_PORTR|nr:hypothetical protein [Portunus trituberculatus]
MPPRNCHRVGRLVDISLVGLLDLGITHFRRRLPHPGPLLASPPAAPPLLVVFPQRLIIHLPRRVARAVASPRQARPSGVEAVNCQATRKKARSKT